MKYKIGDKVSVLDDVISGVVIEIKGDRVVIEGDVGFTFFIAIIIYSLTTRLSPFD